MFFKQAIKLEIYLKFRKIELNYARQITNSISIQKSCMILEVSSELAIFPQISDWNLKEW